MKSCCVTGHREIAAGKAKYVRQELRREVQKALQDGITDFYTGMAQGVDLEFAKIIIAEKALDARVKLIAAVPYAGRMKTKEPSFHEIIRYCDDVVIICPVYRKDCYHKRNEYLVEHSDRVIAVFDGREKSGTAMTIRIAQTKGVETKIIKI